MIVAFSKWGAVLQSWRTTDNAAEGLARQANDGFLALDELSQVDGFSADAMTYMLGNGTGKARSRRDGATKPVEQFRLAFLSSGETGLAAKMQENGRRPKAGQTVRFIEFPADAGCGHGAFDNLHEFPDGNRFSIELKHLAGPVIDGVAKAKKYWAEKNIPADSDGQVMRVGQKFALVAAVGELAIVSGILPWPVGEAEKACVRLFNDWLAARGGTQAHEGKDAEKSLKAFISEHGSARFEAAWQDEANNSPVDRKIIQRAGFKRMTDAKTWEYFILPPVFEKEVIGSLNKNLVKGYLAQHGLILRDQGGKYTVSMRVPGVGHTRLYYIPASILDGEGDHVDA